MLEILVAEYRAKDGTGDINDDVLNEYQIFQARYKETDGIDILVKKRVLIKKKVRKVYKVQQVKQKCRSPKDIFKFLYTSKLHKVFPNLYKLYPSFLTVPVITAEAERTFLKLKLIKNHQISRMKQKRTTDLALISIERQRTISFTFCLSLAKQLLCKALKCFYIYFSSRS